MEYSFDQVHNYFERLVFEEVALRAQEAAYRDYSPDMLSDVACLALNRLPPRYIRHDVDMLFYLTEQERLAMEHSLDEVLTFSFAFVRERKARSAR